MRFVELHVDTHNYKEGGGEGKGAGGYALLCLLPFAKWQGILLYTQ